MFGLHSYNKSLLRCHPVSTCLIESQRDQNMLTKIDSHKRLQWHYSCCDAVFEASPSRARRHTMICKQHMKGHWNSRFWMNLRGDVADIIRAGILWKINDDDIVDLVFMHSHLQDKEETRRIICILKKLDQVCLCYMVFFV